MKIRLSDHFTYRRLLRFVFPTVLMMIVTFVYGVVDGLFVSNLVGKNAFAAVNLIMPVLMALGAFGFMIGTGGSALVSMTLGEGKKENAKKYFSMLVYLTVGVGMVVSVTGFIFMRQIALLLGASDLIIDDCVQYGRILICSNAFFMLQNSFQSFLVTAERPQLGLTISVLAGLTNVFLDFLFMYVFHMGIAGAAVATAISETVGGIVPLIYFLGPNKSPLRLVRTTIEWKVIGRACANGSSEMLTNLSTSFVSILYNFQLMRIAAENGVAAYGVIMYVNFIFMGLFLGFSIGCGPVVGFHYGAGNKTELKSLLKKSLIMIGTIAIVLTTVAQLTAGKLAGIFVGYDVELLEMTRDGLRLYSFSFLLCGFNIFGSAFFTALGNGGLSALIAALRTLVIQVAAIMILPLIFGTNGIWLAIVVAEAGTLTVTILLIWGNRKRYGYI